MGILPLDRSRISARGLIFLDMILRDSPEWGQFCEMEEVDRPEACALIRLPAPSTSNLVNPWSPDHSNCLWIQADDELTIGFDTTHKHYWGKFPTLGNEIREMRHDIRMILDERFVCVSCWQGDRVTSASLTRLNDAPARRFKSSGRCRIRSWRGTFDREYDLAYRHGDLSSG